MSDPLSQKIDRFLFDQKQQFEFIQTYVSLKQDKEGKPRSDRAALEAMEEILADEYGETSKQVVVAQALLDSLRDGASLASSMKGWFCTEIVLVFEATYRSGDLKSSMNSLLEDMDAQHSLRGKFLKSLGMPSMIMLFGIMVAMILSLVYMPLMTDLIAEKDMGTLAKVYGGLGNLLSDNGFAVLATIVVLVVVIKLSLTRWVGETRMMVESIPPYSIFNAFESSRFFSVLTLLVEAGMSMRQALEVIEPYSSPYLRWHIGEMLRMTRRGAHSLTQLDTGLLPSRLRVRLRVAGENSSASADEAFASIASNAGDDFKAKIESSQKKLSTIILLSGITLLLVGVITMLDLMMTVALEGF